MSHVPMTVPVVVQVANLAGRVSAPLTGSGSPCQRALKRAVCSPGVKKGQTKRGHLMLRLP